MKRSSPLQALASSPTMVGAITTLIVIVAVFLAYNANNGLPFVPVYRVSVVVPNAARLVPNNEVRIGGSRVGVVESIDAVRLPLDDPEADTVVQRRHRRGRRPAQPEARQVGVAASRGLDLPDSLQVVVRPQVPRDHPRRRARWRAEGFVFNGTNDNDDPADDDEQILSIDEIESNEGADDGTFVAQTEFDEIGNTFDQATRNAIRQNLAGYGDAFAGRGTSLNQAIEALNPLLGNLRPVAQTLNDERDQPRRTSSRPWPVRPRSSRRSPMSRRRCSATWRPRSLRSPPTRRRSRRSISGGPPALQTGIDVLPAQQPFLAEFAELFRRLQPGVQDLRISLPSLNSAIRRRHAGSRPQRRREPAPPRRLPPAREAGRAADHEELAGAARGPVRRGQAARQVGHSLADRLQLLELLLDAAARAPDRARLDRLLAARLADQLARGSDHGRPRAVRGPRRRPLPPVSAPIHTGRARSRPASRPAATRAPRRRAAPTARPPGDDPTPGEFEPHELPILHANPAAPTGQNGSDCQPGQTGYLLGRPAGARPGQGQPVGHRPRHPRRPRHHRRLLHP